MTGNVVSLRVPLNPEYVPILRATTGIVAGTLAFSYDEIMEVRTAISEVFDLALSHALQEEPATGRHELAIRFTLEPGKVEIVASGPAIYSGHGESEEARERQALVKSLMDEVEFGADAYGKYLVRMIKYRSTRESSEEPAGR